MERRPGFWIYALTTAAAAGGVVVMSAALGVSGRWDVAVTIAVLAGAVYLVAPVDQRGQATRLFAMAGLALVGLMFGSVAGALFGAAVAADAILEAESGAEREAGVVVIVASVVGVATCVYLAVFAAGWPMVKPRDPEPDRTPSIF